MSGSSFWRYYLLFMVRQAHHERAILTTNGRYIEGFSSVGDLSWTQPDKSQPEETGWFLSGCIRCRRPCGQQGKRPCLRFCCVLVAVRRTADVKQPVFQQLLPLVLSLSKDEWRQFLAILSSVHGSTSSPRTGDIHHERAIFTTNGRYSPRTGDILKVLVQSMTFAGRSQTRASRKRLAGSCLAA